MVCGLDCFLSKAETEQFPAHIKLSRSWMMHVKETRKVIQRAIWIGPSAKELGTCAFSKPEKPFKSQVWSSVQWPWTLTPWCNVRTQPVLLWESGKTFKAFLYEWQCRVTPWLFLGKQTHYDQLVLESECHRKMSHSLKNRTKPSRAFLSALFGAQIAFPLLCPDFNKGRILVQLLSFIMNQPVAPLCSCGAGG